jgi:hypothetical protein
LSWINKTLICSAATVALLGAEAAMADSAMAKAIVIKATGPSARAYTPGKSIAENTSITLKAGDVVTILDGQGTRVLKGPGTFSTTASTQTASNVTSVLKNTGTRQVRTGAVRGAVSTAPIRPTNVWLVDASKSATVCVTGSEPVSFWVPSGEAESSVTLTRVSDGKSMPMPLRAMQSVKAWPAEFMPITDGAQYKVTRATGETATIRFATIGANPQGLENTISAFVRAGCNSQLDLLIETVSVPSAEDGPAG